MEVGKDGGRKGGGGGKAQDCKYVGGSWKRKEGEWRGRMEEGDRIGGVGIEEGGGG